MNKVRKNTLRIIAGLVLVGLSPVTGILSPILLTSQLCQDHILENAIAGKDVDQPFFPCVDTVLWLALTGALVPLGVGILLILLSRDNK